MPTKDGQFEYPETPWSMGKMAKAGPRQGPTGKEFKEIEGLRREKSGQSELLSQNSPAAQSQGIGQMSTEEWQQYWQGNWDVIGKHHKVDPSKADPSGILIDKTHPQIKELQDQGWETLQPPKEEEKGWGQQYQLMRPKATPAPLVSEAAQQGAVT